MRKLFLALVALLMLTGRAMAADIPTGFLNKTAMVNGASYSYVLYVPKNFSADKKWPVVLFLHGSGERGDDGLKQSQTGIGSAVRQHPDRFPGLVIMPQCAPGKSWSGEMADFALKALDQTVSDYNGDTNRLYLTGLSMGGYGSWLIASEHPDKFAAVVPICGGAREPASVAEKVKKLPIWIFHGEADPTVNVEKAREMVKALKEANASTVKYTEYPGVGHNSWDKAYDEKDLAEWLFAQKKADSK